MAAVLSSLAEGMAEAAEAYGVAQSSLAESASTIFRRVGARASKLAEELLEHSVAPEPVSFRGAMLWFS